MVAHRKSECLSLVNSVWSFDQLLSKVSSSEVTHVQKVFRILKILFLHHDECLNIKRSIMSSGRDVQTYPNMTKAIGKLSCQPKGWYMSEYCYRTYP